MSRPLTGTQLRRFEQELNTIRSTKESTLTREFVTDITKLDAARLKAKSKLMLDTGVSQYNVSSYLNTYVDLHNHYPKFVKPIPAVEAFLKEQVKYQILEAINAEKRTAARAKINKDFQTILNQAIFKDVEWALEQLTKLQTN